MKKIELQKQIADVEILIGRAISRQNEQKAIIDLLSKKCDIMKKYLKSI